MNKNNPLFQFCLRIGDSSLIQGHRLSEWCGHGPILEEDIAIINISLDLIGQARFMLSYAGEVEGKGRTEDDLAYHRDAMEFRNYLITEQHNGDYAETIARQFLFSAFSYHFYDALQKSKDAKLSAFAEKSLKEVTYHLRHTGEWTVRLGDGTSESHERIQNAIDDLWTYTGDMFTTDNNYNQLLKDGIAPNLDDIKLEWDKTVNEVFDKATLSIPEESFMIYGSQEGKHSEHLGFLLAEMQFLPRAYPGTEW